MKIENFCKAEQIAIRVRHLKEQLKMWETVESFKTYIGVSLTTHSNWMDITTEFMPFEVIKITCIALIQREIELQTKEYEQLQ